MEIEERDSFEMSEQQFCQFPHINVTEASWCLADEPESIAHESVKRLLERQPHHTEALYDKAKRLIRADEGVLVIDDSTLDKPYSHQIELVTRHWSGKHHRVVQGINLISTIWTDGSAIVPVDFRIYNPDKDGKNKNDHFRDMVRAAAERKFEPGCVIFDSWYSSIDNLKLIRSLKWHWCTRLKSNRLVDPDHSYNRSVSDIDIPPEGRVVHLRQYGFIKVFRIVHSNKEPEHWATDILDASESDRKSFKDFGWNIEEYHRGIKQCCGIERCKGRKEVVQLGHIFLSLLEFLRLESHRLNTGSSWYESKRSIHRPTSSLFIASPSF
jgi:putative transposase